MRRTSFRAGRSRIRKGQRLKGRSGECGCRACVALAESALVVCVGLPNVYGGLFIWHGVEAHRLGTKGNTGRSVKVEGAGLKLLDAKWARTLEGPQLINHRCGPSCVRTPNQNTECLTDSSPITYSISDGRRSITSSSWRLMSLSYSGSRPRSPFRGLHLVQP